LAKHSALFTTKMLALRDKRQVFNIFCNWMKFQEKKFPSPQIAIDSGSDKYLLFSRLCKHNLTCLGDHDHMCFVAIDIERKNK
jgi:hypothetical protein